MDGLVDRSIYLMAYIPFTFLVATFHGTLPLLRRSIRSVPALITAVVVVFVTKDGWKLLGTGFTWRLFSLVIVFLLVSLLFLIRLKNYWKEDIDVEELHDNIDNDASKGTTAALLRGIQNSISTDDWYQISNLICWGAKPAPLVKPVGHGRRAYVYGCYVLLWAFTLIFTMLLVSAALIVVGMILIGANETQDLAGSADIYWTFHGIVITKQLVSISLSLGAFSVLFLVAAQRTEERREFKSDVLGYFRQALLLYSIYCRAHDSAQAWTGVPVKSVPLAPEGSGDVVIGRIPSSDP